MAKGGARNRSGPQSDPNSIRSAQRGIVLTALPSEGYSGVVPKFPLVESLTDAITGPRELEIWAEAWATPQACAWAKESWRWPAIAEYCRLKATVEVAPASNAALITQLHRYRDQIGLTPAGLKENGWAIAKDELAERQPAVGSKAKPKKASARSRMTVVPSATAG